MVTDETVYILENRIRGDIDAIGVPMLDSQPNFLVGLYLGWHVVDDQEAFLQEILTSFGDARFFTPDKKLYPGLVCKMSIETNQLTRLQKNVPDDFHRIRAELLEIRVSNPKPFLNLTYDTDKCLWTYRPITQFSMNSNCSLVSN